MTRKFCGLTVTGVLLQQYQTCLWREERGQAMVLVALRDDAGNTGHLVYGCETDKRDIEEEDIYTDNEAFAEIIKTGIYPDGPADFQELFAMADDTTPKERTEEIDEILGACWNGTQIEGNSGY